MAKKTTSPKDPKVEELKAALQLAELKLEALNTLIDIAENRFNIDIRKNPKKKSNPN